MKEIIQRAAGPVGVSKHSAVNNDTLRAIQRIVQEEKVRDEVDLMAAEGGAMGLAVSEAQASSLSCEGPTYPDERSYDNMNLMRRNDTRYVPAVM